MRSKSNVIKSKVEKGWGARYTLGARYVLENKVQRRLCNTLTIEGLKMTQVKSKTCNM
jgi:hypothetical protein